MYNPPSVCFEILLDFLDNKIFGPHCGSLEKQEYLILFETCFNPNAYYI
jgi:hypothetical protein